MKARLRRVAGTMVLVAVVAAAPAALWPWGWLATGALLIVAALVLTRHLRRAYVEPVQQLASNVASGAGESRASVAEVIRSVVSEHREAVGRLEQVRESARRGRTVLDHSADGVIVLTGELMIEYTNPAARGLLQKPLEPLTRLTSPELDRVALTAARNGAPVVEELTVRTPVARHVLARAVPVSGDGIALLLQDLSDRDRIDRVRRDFVANVSHELKTPVAAVLALAEVAESALADGDMQSAASFLARLQADAERLGDLVTDLLDLSKVEAGSQVDLHPVDVRDVVDSALESARSIAELKGLRLEGSGPHMVVEADPAQLDMAVRNLVDNAVRYSETGTIRAELEERDGWTCIRVADEGLGIPSDQLSRIFERFYRVDRARSRATGGTGLGLSIVRHVAENHGGRVEVQSEVGRGSTFTLLLPVRQTPGQDSAA